MFGNNVNLHVTVRGSLLFPFLFSGGGKVDLLSRLMSVKSDHLCLRGFAKMLSDLACLQL